MQLRLLDLDGALDHQAPIQQAVASGVMERIEARDLAPRLRIVANRQAYTALSARLQASFASGSGKGPRVTFYGSGDFHHLTTAMIAACEGPLTVIHFDNHPDWVAFPKTHNCGAWVNRALDVPHVARVITLGPCSDDLVRPQLQMANLRAVEQGRLCVFPYRHEPSRVYGSFAPCPSYEWRQGALDWRCLDGLSVEQILALVTPLITTEKLYVTFDKDVLCNLEACTNWDQGHMRLETVLSLIKTLASQFEVVGFDVCGDWSDPVFDDAFRWLLSALDRPKTQPDAQALVCNVQTNARILSWFEDVFSK
jgi:arginase family enzyme